MNIIARYNFRIAWTLLIVLFTDIGIVYSTPPLNTLLRIPVAQEKTVTRVGEANSIFCPRSNENNTQCELCGSKESNALFSFDNCIIVKCSSCGLIWMRHPMSFEIAKKFYEEEYYTGKNGNVESSLYAGGDRFRTYEANKRLDTIKRISDINSLLDIGFGMGYFLKVASDRGIQCEGIDISTRAIDHAISIGLNAKQGDFAKTNYDKYFDVITLWASIEHLHNVEAYLLKAHSLLKPNGLIVIETGDIDSIQAKLFGKNWRLFMQEHNYYFSSKTLDILLRKTGFITIKTEYDGFTEGIISQIGLRRFALEKFKRQTKDTQDFSSTIKVLINYIAGKFHLGDVMIKYAVKVENTEHLQINSGTRMTISSSI